MAVNLHLAEKYSKASLWPSSVVDRGYAYQWSLWVTTAAEAYLFNAAGEHRVSAPRAAQRTRRGHCMRGARGAAEGLGGALAGRQYLLGGDFTTADLNVASVPSQEMQLEPDLSATPAVHLSRPAVANVRGRR